AQLFHAVLERPPAGQDSFLAALRNTADAWDHTALELEARRSAPDSRPACHGELFGAYRIALNPPQETTAGHRSPCFPPRLRASGGNSTPYLASRQFGPTPTSTSSGTFNSRT